MSSSTDSKVPQDVQFSKVPASGGRARKVGKMYGAHMCRLSQICSCFRDPPAPTLERCVGQPAVHMCDNLAMCMCLLQSRQALPVLFCCEPLTLSALSLTSRAAGHGWECCQRS